MAEQELGVLEVMDGEMREDLYCASCWNFFGIQVNKITNFSRTESFQQKDSDERKLCYNSQRFLQEFFEKREQKYDEEN